MRQELNSPSPATESPSQTENSPAGAARSIPLQPDAAEKPFDPEALFFGEYAYLTSIRRGFMMSMPFLFIASLITMIINFPIPGFQSFMSDFAGPNWRCPGELVVACTIGFLSLFVPCSLMAAMVEHDNIKNPDKSELSPGIPMITGIVCIFIILAPQIAPSGVLLSTLDIKDLPGALIIAFLSVRLFISLARASNIRSLFFREYSDPLLPGIFEALLPATITILAFLVGGTVLSTLSDRNFFTIVYSIFLIPFDSLQHTLAENEIYALLSQIRLFLGMYDPIMMSPAMAQVSAPLEGTSLLYLNSPPDILNLNFFTVFIYMGGAGGTLGLLIAILGNSRDSGQIRISKLAIVPSLFNINEMVIFGLPVVFNPLYLIPFILTPIILVAVDFTALSTGLVPPPVYSVEWTTPAVFSGIAATGSWKGAGLQIINMVIATAIYIPFVRLGNRRKIQKRQEVFHELITVSMTGSYGSKGKRLTTRPGDIGLLARSLANDLLDALSRPNEIFFLHFQPRVNLVEKRTISVEALLRWTHPVYGPVPPRLTFALADDTGLRSRLDNHIIMQAFKQQREWRDMGVDVLVSVNISEGQLKDEEFPLMLMSLFTRFDLPPGSIQIEAPEHLALEPTGKYNSMLRRIHDTGALLAVDEFGKSYRMISQLKQLPIQNIQIANTLVKDITTNHLGQDAAASIQEMVMNMGLNSSVEYVENKEQLDTLLELNFSSFQGFLFARALSPEDCLKFIREFNGKVN